MTVDKTFLLPDVGEGLTEAEVLTWHVKVGDVVVVNQVIVEIETAKAAVELPCPYAGVVASIHVEAGQVVPVGVPLLTITVPELSHEGAPGGPRGLSGAPVEPTDVETPTREAVLVGYGVRQTGAPSRRARTQSSTPTGTAEREAGPPGEVTKPVRHGGLEMGRRAEELLSKQSPVLAKPPVRKLARDLSVDLTAVDPTGVGGVVTRADVERAARIVDSVGPVSGLLGLLGHPHVQMGGRSEGWVAEERIPVRGVGKAMADAMVHSAFTAPHVTEWVDVDVTRSLRLVARLKARPELAEVKVSPLLLVAAGLIRAIKKHPGINASWDEVAGEILVKNYVNLGIAAATPRGLVVPNVKDADALDLRQLATALHSLVGVAREGKTALTDMQRGTITITNVGVFGVDSGTPIINPGEAAILCMGRAIARPWVHKGKVKPRQVMTVALSFDHRMVDGALGSQVLCEVAAFLTDPEFALSLG